MPGHRTRLPLLLVILAMAAVVASVTRMRRVVVHPKRWHGHSYLLCSLVSYDGGELLRFSWARASANGTGHVLSAVTREAFHRALIGGQINIGDQVYCDVGRAPGAWRRLAPPLRSPAVHLGVTWTSHQTPDAGLQLTVTSSVPIACQHGHRCRLLLRIWLQPEEPAAIQPAILLDKCVISLNCPRGVCWSEVVTATVNSQTLGPGTSVTAQLMTEVTNSADVGPEWDGYRPPPVTLTVRPSAPLVCQLIGASYVIGFSGRYRRPSRGGDLRLLTSRAPSGQTITISTVTAPCSVRGSGTFCSCSATVRVDSEWVRLDVCRHPTSRRQPPLQRSSLPGRKHSLHVLETRPDSAWLITCGSDLVVRLHAFSVGRRDGHTTPLFDGDEALFVTVSVGSHRGITGGLCSDTGTDDVTRLPDDLRRKRELPTQDHLEELPFEDLSDHLFSGALEPETPQETTAEMSPETPPEAPLKTAAQSQTKAPWKKEHEVQSEISPGLATQREVRPDFRTDMFPDTVPETEKAASVREKVISGSVITPGPTSEPSTASLSRRRACESVIATSELSSACAARISPAVLSALTDICQSDTGWLVTGERWSKLLPPLLEDRCQVAALSQSPPSKRALQCTESCSGDGCDQSSNESLRYDQQSASAAPRVTSVGHRGLCDLAAASCGSVPVLGQHFWPSVGLRCRVRQKGKRKWRIAAATYRSETEVQCHLPIASLRRIRHLPDVVRWTVQVSYNGASWSDPLVLNTFNGDCQICRARANGVFCAAVVTSCIIEGQCYRAGDTNPRNPCRYCGSNRHQWVTRTEEGCSRGQPVTCQTVGPVCQHGLCVEDSRGAICVCQPGYIGTHCQIREQLPDSVTIEQEMGDEALYGRHQQPDAQLDHR